MSTTGELLKVSKKSSKVSDSTPVFWAIFKQRTAKGLAAFEAYKRPIGAFDRPTKAT